MKATVVRGKCEQCRVYTDDAGKNIDSVVCLDGRRRFSGERCGVSSNNRRYSSCITGHDGMEESKLYKGSFGLVSQNR